MELAAPVVLGDVEDIDTVHITLSVASPDTPISNLFFSRDDSRTVSRGMWKPDARLIPQPAAHTRQLLLTFPSIGSGMAANTTHQTAQVAASAMLAFTGTNTETFCLCITLYLSARLCCVLLVNQIYRAYL